MLYLGKSEKVLKYLDASSIDAIVCDPPYGLKFMGKKWDYNVPTVELWKEALRVLKPGGHLLSFGGARTYHRMVVNIEDAGFEIRDQIMWCFGSGFPKSHNIGKSVDKLQGNEREALGRNPNSRENSDKSNTLYESGTVGKTDTITKGTSEWEGWGTALKPAHEPIVLARKPISEKTIAKNVLKYRTGGINIDGTRVGNEKISVNVDYKDNKQSKDWGTKKCITEKKEQGRFPANFIHDGSDEVLELFPDTKSQGHWSKTKTTGFGKFGNGKSIYKGVGKKDKLGGSTARFFKEIKPDHEPIVLARKPISEKTIAKNVLKHRTGGINIDGTRVEIDGKDDRSAGNRTKTFGIHKEPVSGGEGSPGYVPNKKGRFPANFIHDGSEEVVELFPNTGKGNGNGVYNYSGKEYNNKDTSMFNGDKPQAPSNFNDSGSAARFFYCPKVSKKERNAGLEDFEPKSIGAKGNGLSRTCDICGASIIGGCKCENRTYSNPIKKNNHPTVKPVALMRYLCRLITPKGGTVLDPFMGSGSTGVAAKLEGFKFIGIDSKKEYYDIAVARIKHATKKLKKDK